MNLTDEKPCPDKEATRTTPSRIVEIRQVLEDYGTHPVKAPARPLLAEG